MNAPTQIAAIFSDLGVTKANLPRGKAFLMAVLAGMFIAFAGVGATVGSAVVNRLAGACIFPAGLAMVVVAGSELFTGDNLMLVSLLEKKITAGQMLRTLLIVYAGNLVGSLFVALFAVYGGSVGAFAENIVSAAAAKASMHPVEMLFRGMLCNILVCIAVWMAAAAQTPGGKIVALYGPIMLFVLCGFEHCVANMYYLPAGILAASRYGIAAEGLSCGTALLNLLLVTVGNMIGGFAVGHVYWEIYLRKRSA